MVLVDHVFKVDILWSSFTFIIAKKQCHILLYFSFGGPRKKVNDDTTNAIHNHMNEILCIPIHRVNFISIRRPLPLLIYNTDDMQI